MKVTGRVPTSMGPRTLVVQGLTEDMADLLADLVRHAGGGVVIERDGPRVDLEKWRARQHAKDKRAITVATKRHAAKRTPAKQPDPPRLTVVRNEQSDTASTMRGLELWVPAIGAVNGDGRQVVIARRLVEIAKSVNSALAETNPSLRHRRGER